MSYSINIKHKYRINEVIIYNDRCNFDPPIIGIILDIYSKPEDFCRYLKRQISMFPDDTVDYQKRYKLHSSNYRQTTHSECGEFYLILCGDEKHLTRNIAIHKMTP